MQASASARHVIVGLGMTGLSCARYLRREGQPFIAMDTRQQPPGIEAFRQEFPEVELTLGRLDGDSLAAAGVLLLSPGVDPRLGEIRAAREAGVELSGDIQLFSRAVRAPIVAITGSNAKSTVTTLVGEMARRAGLNACTAGNIGTPVLDLLAQEQAELYVLELSSFQLETTSELGAAVATVLNLSEDHMDRYDSFADYREAKHRIFQSCRRIVINRDDPNSIPGDLAGREVYSFGLQPAAEGNAFMPREHEGVEYLACGEELLMPVSELRIAGRHNVANALAALALGHAAGLERSAMLQTLREFTGLKHRCQWVAEIDGVSWYNDSKGTNVGATVAAIDGLGADGNVLLLAGGVGKGADFSGLAPAMARHGRMAILFGEDAPRIAAALEGHVGLRFADSLQQAVALAREAAVQGDAVLLSPACASFDMFDNYQHRGDVFVEAVEAVKAGQSAETADGGAGAKGAEGAEIKRRLQ